MQIRYRGNTFNTMTVFNGTYPHRNTSEKLARYGMAFSKKTVDIVVSEQQVEKVFMKISVHALTIILNI